MNKRNDTKCAPAAKARCAAGGFTLIEVLLSAAILLIALLGVAAVFPRVLLTQQDASRTVAAIPQEQRAIAALLGRTAAGQEFWTEWAAQAPFIATVTPTLPPGATILPQSGAWYVPQVVGQARPLLPGAAIVPHGGLVLGTITQEFSQNFNTAARDILVDRRVVIPLGERLRLETPNAPFSSGSVWDMGVRRLVARDFAGTAPAAVSGNSSPDTRVQVAVFVRPLDPRLSVIPGEANNAVKNVREALLTRFEGLGADDRRLPLAASPTEGPSFDGLFNDRIYSNLMVLPVLPGFTPSATNGQLLQLFNYGNAGPFPFETLMALLRVPGQQLVDDDGNVLIVAASNASDPADSVRLTKPLVNFNISQVLVSPQKPSRVYVFVVNP